MPKITSIRLFILISIGLLTLTACGGAAPDLAEPLEEAETFQDEPAAAAEAGIMVTTLPDACSLLTNEEIALATGGLAPLSANGGVDEDGLFSSCTWVFSDNVGSLSLNLWSSGEATMGWAAQFLEIQMSGFASESGEPMTVDGLGDQAFLAAGNEVYGLWWRQGNEVVAGLTAAALPIDEAAMIQLGQAANDFR